MDGIYYILIGVSLFISLLLIRAVLLIPGLVKNTRIQNRLLTLVAEKLGVDPAEIFEALEKQKDSAD